MNRFVVLAATIGAALLLIAPGAQGFKPYTHNYTGNQARADAADGHVTIAGREYPVPGQVAQALHDWPTYYNAGVVGPDGFPDLTMGQSVIHPVHTGQWLQYILNRAWAAQDDPTYTAQEKSQMLAFAYGFMTHAAGDMWAHTLVNEQREAACSRASSEIAHELARRRDRDPPHHPRGLHRRRDAGLRRERRPHDAAGRRRQRRLVSRAPASTLRFAGSTRRSSIPMPSALPRPHADR